MAVERHRDQLRTETMAQHRNPFVNRLPDEAPLRLEPWQILRVGIERTTEKDETGYWGILDEFGIGAVKRKDLVRKPMPLQHVDDVTGPVQR